MYLLKMLSIIIALLAATALATSVSYDLKYDDPNARLDSVACSDGPNGVMTRYGWQTQGQVAGFPFIGGAEAVEKWNSANCGTCWMAHYNNTLIHVLAIDHTQRGFNIGLQAMNKLTGGNAQFLAASRRMCRWLTRLIVGCRGIDGDGDLDV